MGSEELSIIGGLKEDMKEVKETLKEVLASLNAMKERFISNEKDVERMINEYIRLNAEYKAESAAVKAQVREQDDLIWSEIRRCQGTCAVTKKEYKEETDSKIEKAIIQVKKDIKGWLAVATLSGISAIVLIIISNIVRSVVK